MSLSASQAPLAHQINSACQRLGIGRTKLYSLISENKIRVFKIGKRTLVPESELQRFVTESMQ